MLFQFGAGRTGGRYASGYARILGAIKESLFVGSGIPNRGSLSKEFGPSEPQPANRMACPPMTRLLKHVLCQDSLPMDWLQLLFHNRHASRDPTL